MRSFILSSSVSLLCLFLLSCPVAAQLNIPSNAPSMHSDKKGFSLEEYKNIPEGLLMPPSVKPSEKTQDSNQSAAAAGTSTIANTGQKPVDGKTIVQTTTSKLDYQAAVALYKKGDYQDAVKNLRPLANNGHQGAQELLGIMYEMGQGVPKTPALAFSLLSKAADAGRPLAEHHLGIMYYTGTGVTADPLKALMWLYVAIAHYPDGPEKARAEQDRDHLLSQLNRRDRESAFLMARDWLGQKGEAHLLKSP